MTSGGGSLAGRPSTAVSRRLPAPVKGGALAMVLAVIPGTASNPIPELLMECDPLLGRRIGLRRQSNERRDRIRRLHIEV